MPDRVIVVYSCGEEEDRLEELESSFAQTIGDTRSYQDSLDSGPLSGVVFVPPPMVFEIVHVQSSRPLFLDRLADEFRGATVRLVFEIDSSGRVSRMVDSYDGGQPAALDIVWRSVRTWRYPGYLHGTMCIDIDTFRHRLSFDDSGLKPVAGLEDSSIERGKMLLVRTESRERRFSVARRQCD